MIVSIKSNPTDMQISEALIATNQELMKVGIENPAMEARILLQYATHCTKEYLLTHSRETMSERQRTLLSEITRRRRSLEPIAYIMGCKEFFGREFIVNPHVLIPRPDSEILIETVIADYGYCKQESKGSILNILDLGTGSGCLIITLLLELRNAIGTAVDIDINALNVAKANASKHEVHSIEFVLGNWFDELKYRCHPREGGDSEKNISPSEDKVLDSSLYENDNAYSKFDIIVANPPYISSSDNNVAKETMLYEPHLALFGENHGLKPFEIIASNAKHFLKPQGALYLEIGYNQFDVIVDLYKKQGYKLKTKALDLAGHIRCLKFQI
jgi:release factor glutamine methyltransferase